MTGWLLDTKIISELRRPRPEPRVVHFFKGRSLDLLYISVVTLAGFQTISPGLPAGQEKYAVRRA